MWDVGAAKASEPSKPSFKTRFDVREPVTSGSDGGGRVIGGTVIGASGQRAGADRGNHDERVPVGVIGAIGSSLGKEVTKPPSKTRFDVREATPIGGSSRSEVGVGRSRSAQGGAIGGSSRFAEGSGLVPTVSAPVRTRFDQRSPGPPQDFSAPAAKPSCMAISALRVGDLALEATEADIQSAFEHAGFVVEVVHVPLDRDRKSRGYALVYIKVQDLQEPDVATDFALHRMRGTEILGSPITVEVKQESSDGDAAVRLDGSASRMVGVGGRGLAGSVHAGLRRIPGVGAMAGPSGLEVNLSANLAANLAAARGPLRKTQICNYWREGRCTRGQICAFAHGEVEIDPEVRARRLADTTRLLREAGPLKEPRAFFSPGLSQDSKFVVNRKTQICMYWKEQRCTRGASCSFAHGEEELLKDPVHRSMMEEMRRQREAREKAPLPSVRSKTRSPRRSKPVTFVKGGTLEAVNRTESVVTEPQSAVNARGNSLSKAEGSEMPRAAKAGGGVSGAASEGAHQKEDTNRGMSTKAEVHPNGNWEQFKPAPFLLTEDGTPHLVETYRLGATLLKGMGWQCGRGVGKVLGGALEPVSVHTMKLPSIHFGSKDRRCLGIKKPKKFKDSDEESASAGSGSSSSSSSVRPKRSNSSVSSKSSGHTKRRSRRKRRKTSASSRSFSSSSSSSGSSSSRSRPARKKRSTGKDKGSSKRGGSSARAGAEAAVVVTGGAVKEPPEIALAKKQVLAKLTDIKGIESKDQRAKEFRQLLREWHPDKNPERIDMATAVFQFLQKGKSLLNLK